MNRRELLKTGGVGAISAVSALGHASAEPGEHSSLDVFYFADPVILVRADPDGSLTHLDGQVWGAVRRPRNFARERREQIGPNHWDLLFYQSTLPSQDEAYYEQRRPVLKAMYIDMARYESGIVDSPYRTVDSVAHIGDAGEGIHRWIGPGEEALPLSAWKWNLGSIPAEDVWHLVAKRSENADMFE